MRTRMMMYAALSIMFVASALQAAEKEPSAWAEKVKMGGDFRFRHEYKDVDGAKERNRQRIRLRLKLEGKVNDAVKIKTRFASGSDDPVSTNQSLDGGFSSKNFMLDQAYFEWKAADGLKVLGGKMSNPFANNLNQNIHKLGLVWDGDLTPEGAVLRFEGDMEGVKPYANAGYFWVEEDGSGSDDIFLYGGNLGCAIEMGEMGACVGVSYYMYDELKGMDPIAGEKAGNTMDVTITMEEEDGEMVEVSGDPTYANDFNIFEAYADVSMKMGDVKLNVLGDYTLNTEADNDDTAYCVGLKISGKAPRKWSVQYNYRDVDANAVVGALNDSDFAGGNTDAKGHVVKGGINVMDAWDLGLAYLAAKRGDAEKTYDVIQADLKFKF